MPWAMSTRQPTTPTAMSSARPTPTGHTTTYTYDADNRQTAVQIPSAMPTTTTYDADGNIISTTDPLGHTTTYTYDADNRQVAETDALGGMTKTTYDARRQYHERDRFRRQCDNLYLRRR